MLLSYGGQIFPQIVALIVTSFGLVAALAWNTAIQNSFNKYFPEKSGTRLFPQFVYAVLVSIFVIIVTMILIKISESIKNRFKG